MPKLAANLSMLFGEVEFLDRFEAAARAGFQAVEMLFPYDHPAEELRRRLDRYGLTQALFNAPPGDWAAGERGIATVPGRSAEFEAGFAKALDYARVLGCPRVHVMAGIVMPADDRQRAEDTYVASLRRAADMAAPHGVQCLIEPLNTRDVPGYFLTDADEARRILERVGRDNARLQLDLYHRQIMRGDLAGAIESFLPITGHIQIAGVPGRHEPDVGEINYRFLFDRLDELGYDGWIGCEYRPRATTVAGLGWARPWGIGR
ncbi:MAG: 2-oxo-tetronate isomerase [Alphaproteobacteria bacterium]